MIMTKRKNKPGQGRPRNITKTRSKNITLPVYLIEWIAQYPGTVSQNISKILGAIYEQHKDDKK